MRIAHILPALTKGGGERVAVDLANQLAAMGHEVCIIAGWPVDPGLLADRIAPGVELRFMMDQAGSRLARYRAIPRWVRREWNWLAGFDVVHCHLTYAALAGSLIYRRRRRKGGTAPAVVETYHAVGASVPAMSRRFGATMAKMRDGLALMALDAFWSRFMARRAGNNVALILNGVSFPRPVSDAETLEWRAAAGIPANVRLVGTIGALRSDREMERYVPVFARIAKQVGSDVHFVIGGEGSARETVERAVATSGIAERIHLPGLIHDPAVTLGALDLYLTHNVGPVTGIAALEAAGAGVAQLALQIDPDYQPQPDDLSWSSGDSSALADEAARLLGDRAALAALAEKQKSGARATRSVEAMATAYVGLYEAAVHAAGRR